MDFNNDNIHEELTTPEASFYETSFHTLVFDTPNSNNPFHGNVLLSGASFPKLDEHMDLSELFDQCHAEITSNSSFDRFIGKSLLPDFTLASYDSQELNYCHPFGVSDPGQSGSLSNHGDESNCSSFTKEESAHSQASTTDNNNKSSSLSTVELNSFSNCLSQHPSQTDGIHCLASILPMDFTVADLGPTLGPIKPIKNPSESMQDLASTPSNAINFKMKSNTKLDPTTATALNFSLRFPDVTPSSLWTNGNALNNAFTLANPAAPALGSRKENGLNKMKTSPPSTVNEFQLPSYNHYEGVQNPSVGSGLQNLNGGETFSLTEEEKRTLLSEGYPIPSHFPLNKQEEKILKKIRRKIKNKLSAHESRRKKKEHLENLEKIVQKYSAENEDLHRRVKNLEEANISLLKQLQCVQTLREHLVISASMHNDSSMNSSTGSSGTTPSPCRELSDKSSLEDTNDTSRWTSSLGHMFPNKTSANFMVILLSFSLLLFPSTWLPSVGRGSRGVHNHHRQMSHVMSHSSDNIRTSSEPVLNNGISAAMQYSYHIDIHPEQFICNLFCSPENVKMGPEISSPDDQGGANIYGVSRVFDDVETNMQGLFHPIVPAVIAYGFNNSFMDYKESLLANSSALDTTFVSTVSHFCANIIH